MKGKMNFSNKNVIDSHGPKQQQKGKKQNNEYTNSETEEEDDYMSASFVDEKLK